MKRSRCLYLSGACLGLALSLAGCGGSKSGLVNSGGTTPPTSSATPSANPATADVANDSCLSDAQKAAAFRIATPDGGHVPAVVLGSGKTTVVLAHMYPSNMCDWFPYAQSLARAGFRVVPFDFSGATNAYPGEVVAVVTWVRAHGGNRVIAMGGSLGASSTVVAASQLGSKIVCAVALSSPANDLGVNALAAAPKVRVPILFGYGTMDTEFVHTVKQVRAKIASARNVLITVSGPLHGAQLVNPTYAFTAKAQHEVLAFLRSCAA
jgi:pimeloyl-ACP methyl ester carboxylesterase